ncbi:MAG TPA: undecaprenyl-phosphate glucose phosphotransferase [Chitinophagaceae bacterium]|nr:undecaprenyl-phosphate glucose phosphotransferase [Chitinophagaceae bacterium]
MNNRFIRFFIIALDLLSLNVLFLSLQYFLNRVDERYGLEYTFFLIFLNATWLIVTWANNLYFEKFLISFEAFARRTVKAYFYWFVIVLFYLFFSRQFELSRLFTGLVMVGFGFLLLINRIIYLFIRSYFRKKKLYTRKILIIGYNSLAKKLVSYLEEEDADTEIIGFCENADRVQELSSYPILGDVSSTLTLSQQHQVTEIISTIAPEQNLKIYDMMREADQACIHFRLIPDLSYFIKKTVHIDYFRDIPVLSVRREPLADAGNRILKRFFDVLVSLPVVLFILSWLVPLIGLLIWIESPGPIFFKQPRTGKGKVTFNCVKFRSMKINNDANLRQASQNDDRFTRIGRFLRRTSLDEFPQFWNVLVGDMSVVGPRPHMLQHTDYYSAMIDKYMIRQFLKPGITGWAQVNGFRGETKTLEKMQGRVQFDIWYIENWNIWLDIRIIFLTVFNTLKGDKNAF